jgi:hypothetical protein
LAANSSSAGSIAGSTAEYAGKKNASATPSRNAITASCQSCSRPVSASTPALPARMIRPTSTPRSSARFGNRSAATPPNRTLSTRPRLDPVATRDSWVGPPPRAITCHTTATSHSPLPNSDTPIEPTSHR